MNIHSLYKKMASKNDKIWYDITKGTLYGLGNEEQNKIKTQANDIIRQKDIDGTLTQDDVSKYYDIFGENPNGISENLKIVENQGNYSLENLGLKDIMDEYMQRHEDLQKQQWEREDSAYQRATQDMLKAGINPNLTGIQPAESSVTINEGLNDSLQGTIELITQEIQNLFESTENDKQRQTAYATAMTLSIIGLLGKYIN